MTPEYNEFGFTAKDANELSAIDTNKIEKTKNRPIFTHVSCSKKVE